MFTVNSNYLQIHISNVIVHDYDKAIVNVRMSVNGRNALEGTEVVGVGEMYAVPVS